MARLTKDVSFRGQKAETLSKAPSKTLIIPGKEVVQVLAKVQLCSLSCNAVVLYICSLLVEPDYRQQSFFFSPFFFGWCGVGECCYLVESYHTRLSHAFLIISDLINGARMCL